MFLLKLQIIVLLGIILAVYLPVMIPASSFQGSSSITGAAPTTEPSGSIPIKDFDDNYLSDSTKQPISEPETLHTETLVKNLEKVQGGSRLPLTRLTRTVKGGDELMMLGEYTGMRFAQYLPKIGQSSYLLDEATERNQQFVNEISYIDDGWNMGTMFDSTAGDIDNDGKEELIIVSFNYKKSTDCSVDLKIYKQEHDDFYLAKEFPDIDDTVGKYCFPSVIAMDYDGDGIDEVVVGGGHDDYRSWYGSYYCLKLYNFDNSLYNPEIHSHAVTGTEFRADGGGPLGNVKRGVVFEKGDYDLDYKEDLLIFGYSTNYFIDVLSFNDVTNRFQNVYNAKNRFIHRPVFGDFTNDGADEIIVPRANCTNKWYDRDEFDPETKSQVLQWDGSTFRPCYEFEGTLMVGEGDINGDMLTEIIYYDSQNGDIKIINSQSAGWPLAYNETLSKDWNYGKRRDKAGYGAYHLLLEPYMPGKIYTSDLNFDTTPEIIIPLRSRYIKWAYGHYKNDKYVQYNFDVGCYASVYDFQIEPVPLTEAEKEQNWPMSEFQESYKMVASMKFTDMVRPLAMDTFNIVLGDYDGDSAKLKYTGQTWSHMGNPSVYAVVAAPPTARGHGANQAEGGGTEVGRSETSSTGISETIASNVGGSIHIGVEIGHEWDIFGVPVAQASISFEAGFTIERDVSRTITNTTTTTIDESFGFSDEEDGVIFFVTTFQNWNYTIITHKNKALVGEVVTLTFPVVSAIQKMNLDDFDDTFPQYRLRDNIPLLNYTVGMPETYPAPSQVPFVMEKIARIQSPEQMVGRGYGSNSVGISLEDETEFAKESSRSYGGYFATEGSIGTMTVQVKLGGEVHGSKTYGDGISVATGSGMSFSGTIGDIAPQDFDLFYYTYSLFVCSQTVSNVVDGKTICFDFLLVHYCTDHFGPAYTPGNRLGIEIRNDYDFDNIADQLYWGGDGSAENPYIIEDMTRLIDNMDALLIRDTSKKFIIRNCNFRGSDQFAGILLVNIHGAVIEQCEIDNFDKGISLSSCSDISMQSNDISSCGDSVFLSKSSGCIIKENNLKGLDQGIGISFYKSRDIVVESNVLEGLNRGIQCESSHNSQILTNSIESCYDGIYVTSASSKNFFYSNSIEQCHSDGITILYSSFNTFESNTVYNGGGTGFRLIQRANNNLVKNNVIFGMKDNGIILRSCTDNVIALNTVRDNDYHGIALEEANDNVLLTNVILDNQLIGIYSESSSRNDIKDNILRSNDRGLYLTAYSQMNIVQDNTIENNVNEGIIVENSLGNFFVGNALAKNTIGIHSVDNSKENRIYNNILIDNTYSGISMDNSSSNRIEENNLLNNPVGLKLDHVSSSTVNDNVFDGITYSSVSLAYSIDNDLRNNEIKHTAYGIELDYSIYQNIASNTVTSCSQFGVFLQNSPDNILLNNVIQDSGFDGIRMITESHANQIIDNKITFSKKNGIFVEKSTDVLIEGNYIASNDENGIEIGRESSNTIISSNAISSNLCGIRLIAANNGIISSNTIIDSRSHGISLSSSNENEFYYNTIESSEEDGYHVSSSFEILINGDTISGSKENGIYLSNSVSPKVHYCNITSNNQTGITLAGTVLSEISGCNIAYNDIGIVCERFSDANSVLTSLIEYNSHSGIIIESSFNVIKSNTVQKNQYGLIINSTTDTELMFTRSNTVQYNVIKENLIHGLLCERTKQNLITLNSFIGNVEYGSYFSINTSSSQLTKNEFIQNNIVDRLYGTSHSQAFDSGSSNYFFENYFDEHDDDTDYSIDGLAGNIDSDPFLDRYHVIAAPVIINPNEGGTYSGIISIQWTPGNDSWGQEITTSLYYSTDGGYVWRLIVEDLPEDSTNFDWNTINYPDNLNYQIMVKVTNKYVRDLSAYSISEVPFGIKNSFRIPGTHTYWVTEIDQSLLLGPSTIPVLAAILTPTIAAAAVVAWRKQDFLKSLLKRGNMEEA